MMVFIFFMNKSLIGVKFDITFVFKVNKCKEMFFNALLKLW